MSENSVFSCVDHINIGPVDVEKSVKFYTELLEFKIVRLRELEKLKEAILELNECVLELWQPLYDMAISNKPGIINHLGVRVTDMNAAVELLKNNGVIFTRLDGTPIPEPDPQFMPEGNYYYCFLLGPSGERIEIIQRL